MEYSVRPSSIEEHLVRQYRVKCIGHTDDLTERYYAISPERKIRNELVLKLVNTACDVFQQR